MELLLLPQAFFVNFLSSPHNISAKRLLFFPLVLQGLGTLRCGSPPRHVGSGLPRHPQPVLQALLDFLGVRMEDSCVLRIPPFVCYILLLICIHLSQEGSGLFQATVI